jgi:DNA-binding NarL/FixJ family response regulator
VDRLTARQREIAELIADGCSDKSIQAKLSISEGTLRTQMERIAERLGLDHTLNMRVQVTWLVIDDSYKRDPKYRCPLPRAPKKIA